MKKNILFIVLSLFIFNTYLFSHSVVLNTADNEDGTMEIFGGFSTGQSAAGAMLKIKSQITSKILYENRIPHSGNLTIKVPNEPYIIILDSGPGHRLEKKGDITPKEGFTQEQKKPYNIAFLVNLILSIGFIVLSIGLVLKRKVKN